MIEPPLKNIGRLAMRVEGTLWCAYWALPNTMEGAQFLGSIRMAFVENNKERRNAFLAMMREAVAEMFATAGIVAESWDELPAPDHERGGTS